MVCKMEKQTDTILEKVVQPLREHVRNGPVNIDETGWRENRQRACAPSSVERIRPCSMRSMTRRQAPSITPLTIG